jgi:hypothetical protein
MRDTQIMFKEKKERKKKLTLLGIEPMALISM